MSSLHDISPPKKLAKSKRGTQHSVKKRYRSSNLFEKDSLRRMKSQDTINVPQLIDKRKDKTSNNTPKVKEKKKKGKRGKASKAWKYALGSCLPQTTMLFNYTVFNRFILLHKIGKGGFGLIYAGIDILTGKEVAIKLEDSTKSKVKYLRLEYVTYRRLYSDWNYFDTNGKAQIPEILQYGQESDFRVLVMEMLGVSLSALFTYCGKKFTLKTTCLLFLQMIDLVEFFHSKGLIHRDIKPGNFVTGRDDHWNSLYLIDFGLTISYLTENGDHIPDNPAKFHGTDKYAPISAHLGREQGRKDDLEALGYVAIYFAKGTLPWEAKNAKADKSQKRDLYKEDKLSISVEELCESLPDEFVDYMKYVNEMEFEDKPDYDYLRTLINRVIERNNYNDGIYDWAREINSF